MTEGTWSASRSSMPVQPTMVRFLSTPSMHAFILALRLSLTSPRASRYSWWNLSNSVSLISR